MTEQERLEFNAALRRLSVSFTEACNNLVRTFEEMRQAWDKAVSDEKQDDREIANVFEKSHTPDWQDQNRG